MQKSYTTSQNLQTLSQLVIAMPEINHQFALLKTASFLRALNFGVKVDPYATSFVWYFLREMDVSFRTLCRKAETITRL